MSEHRTAGRSGGMSEFVGSFGTRAFQLADRLAKWSETPHALTCTYLTPTHRSVAAQRQGWMSAADRATEIDAVGNVIARLPATDPTAKTVIIASHYDTVANAGKYNGRLGILVATVVAERRHKSRHALPFHWEIIGFSEQEGVRFSALYIGSSAVAGRFDPKLLECRDANGQRLDDVMRDGAGRDAVMFDRLTDIAMLFVRCGNDGTSHSPLETVTADDVDLAARVLLDVIVHLNSDTR